MSIEIRVEKAFKVLIIKIISKYFGREVMKTAIPSIL